MSEAHSIATPRTKTKRWLLVIAVIVAAVAGLSLYVAMRERSTNVLVFHISKAALMYPGAQSIVDMANTDGGKTIQLETPDSLDRVERWYQSTLPFTKPVRLTSASVVMEAANLTITLTNEDNKTVILIKGLSKSGP